jgi:HEAT repeat protein
MKRTQIVALVLALAGCETAVPQGGAARPVGKSAATGGTAATPAPRPGAATASVPAKAQVRQSFATLDEALRVLRQSVAHEDRQQEQAVSTWIARQGPEAIPVLATDLGDGGADLGYRLAVCRTLGHLGPAAAGPLIEATRSAPELVRLKAVATLGVLRPAEEKTIDTLVLLLDHADMKMRCEAIRSLGQIGKPAEKATARLQAILNSQASDTERGQASAALKKVAPRIGFRDMNPKP